MPTRRWSQFRQVLRRITFKRIPQRDTIIYDAFSERHLYPLLDMSKVGVFDLEFREVNFWVILRSITFGPPNAKTYLFGYLALARPKIVITTSDNSINFYTIKARFPGITTIAIQNGRRNTFGPRPNSSFQVNLKELQPKAAINFYFTFGTTEQRQFKDLIDGRFITHGNLKNNYLAHVASSRKSGQRVMSYISSFPNLSSGTPSSIDSDLPTHFFGDTAISYRSYFSPEGRVARFLNDYCRRNDIYFQVIGKRDETSPQEADFFRSSVGDSSLRVVPCAPEGASYRALVDSDFVVSIDSTLAYEMFGRGMKTAFLTMRAKAIGIDGVQCPNFGYPEITLDKGRFWTNLDTESEFERVLDFVVKCSDSTWNESASVYRKSVMNVDPDNSELYKLLTELGASHGLGTPEIRRRAKETYGVN